MKMKDKVITRLVEEIEGDFNKSGWMKAIPVTTVLQLLRKHNCFFVVSAGGG